MPLSRKLSLLVREFEKAAIDKSWAGGGDPADIPNIEAGYKLCRKKLWDFLEQLERAAVDGRWEADPDGFTIEERIQLLEERVFGIGGKDADA